MSYFRYIAVAMLFSLVFSAGCGSSRNKVLQDPAANAGTSSEDIWYQYGGARVAYTAVARPKQLHTGYGSVRDPALYGQAPATTKASAKRASKPKPAAAPPRDPNCPPCPPADAAQSPPPSPNPQASPALPPPARSAASPAPPAPAAGVPSATAAAAPPPSPPRLPLPGMPAATPAPISPSAPAR
jgi:hypothetical protein